MAYTACAANLGANIQADCANPPRAGFKGDGILIDLGAVNPRVAVSQTNPRIFTSIALESGDKCCVVDNVWRDPFAGSNRALNVENGRPSYDEQIMMRVPMRSADAASKVVEPLAKSHFLGIFPTIDNKFLVYGYYGKFQASEQTQNEGENGGDWAVTMAANEPYAVVELWDTDYATTKAVYDALVAQAF